MESLGLPSPTSKMRCNDLMTHSSYNDCFSPVDGFCPTADPGRSDALSSTGDIQHMPSQLALVDASLQLCLMPSQPTVTNEPLTTSQMATQLTLTNKQQLVSHTPQSSLTDEPIRFLETEVLNSGKSYSIGHSSSSAEYVKPCDASVNQAEPGSDVQPHTPSTVSQWDSGSDVHRSAPSMPEAVKQNASMSRSGVSNGNTNTGSGEHGSANSATSAGGYPGSWGNHPRYGTDRYSGSRDNRNHFQGRDSGYGGDRNKQPSSASHRPAPKGPRVCKFYESGYCKKGASCSYWHP